MLRVQVQGSRLVDLTEFRGVRAQGIGLGSRA